MARRSLKRSVGTALVTGLLAALAMGAAGAAHASSISGRVTSGGIGLAGEGVIVFGPIVGQDLPIASDILTDASGFYSAGPLADGDYYVETVTEGSLNRGRRG